MPDDRDLMRTHVETRWDVDERGRLVDGPHLVFARTNDGPVIAHGAGVPDSLIDLLGDLLTRATDPGEPGRPPPELADARDLVERALGPTAVSAGPTYVVPAGTSHPATADIATSDRGPDESLRTNRPDNWPAGEWGRLLDGRLGPWAMAVRDGRVIAIAHTPVASEHAADAGAWTDPEFRGQGHASAVTAAWAGLSAWGGRTLFYSTTADNHSSQRVAGRLGLRLLGWIWKLTRVGEEANHAHRAWTP